MDSLIDSYRPSMEKAITHFKEELASIRTGRANPAMVEGIVVEAYGTKTPLLQLATITTPDNKTIMVDPWDKSVIKEIEKALTVANLGLSVGNEGKHLRLVVSPLTEETRHNLIKTLNQRAENSRKTLRGIRDDAKDAIQEAEKNKEISEDEKYRLQKSLDEMTSNYNDQIKELTDKKEAEIKTI